MGRNSGQLFISFYPQNAIETPHVCFSRDGVFIVSSMFFLNAMFFIVRDVPCVEKDQSRGAWIHAWHL